MLVLVSFVLVLAAAVTLVVGLLQSGLTLIYLSIGCSVLAGVVLAVAVLRGRPEPRPAAAGRSFAPPERQQVPASVGAPSTGAEATTGYTAPSYPSAQPTPEPTPAPPPQTPTPTPASASGEDLATKAAGSALLGRLRGRRSQEETPERAPEPELEEVGPEDVEPEPEPVAVAPEPEPAAPVGATTEMPVGARPTEGDDGFPIADYDRLRAIDLLVQLPALDRNQLEAVRQREASGKNRFTIMNRIDALLATKTEPAWEVADEEWEAEAETMVIEADLADVDDDVEATDAFGEVEHDEIDELVSPTEQFPIAGYDSLTVGQILPRLSELDADELAQVRAHEQQGRGRSTILDRIDRLAARAGTGAGATAMPPAARPRRATARTAPAAAKTSRPSKKAAVPAPPAPPVAAPVKKAAKKARATKAAVVVVTPVEAAPATRPSRARKAPAPAPAPPVAAPVKKAARKSGAVSKARPPARKATKRL